MKNLPPDDTDHITSLHQILAHLIQPVSLNIFPNILFSREHCEGSTIFVYPNFMKFLQFLNVTKLSSSSKFRLNQSSMWAPFQLPFFIQIGTLWRKCHFGMSKWYNFFTVPSYAQINIIHQISAQSTIHLIPASTSIFLYNVFLCKASAT